MKLKAKSMNAYFDKNCNKIHKDNPRKFRNTMKPFVNDKYKGNDECQMLNINGTVCNDSDIIVEEFNSYFSNVVKNICKEKPLEYDDCLEDIFSLEIRAKRYSQQKMEGRSFRRPSDRLRQLMATAMSRRHVTRMLESGHVTGWSPGRWPGGCAFPGLGSGWGSPWWCGWLPLPPCGTNPSPGGEWRLLSQRMSVCVG